MELEYSNFELDYDIFGKNQVCGLIDINSTFIDHRIYDVREFKYNKLFKVKTYLWFVGLKNKELMDKLIEDLEISQDLLNKRVKNLSNGELIKYLVLRECLKSDSKTIILRHIDSYLSERDLNTIFKTLKKHIDDINKSVIFATNKVDNIVSTCNRYVIASENRVIYCGSNIDELPEKSEIMQFVDSANKKRANLVYYKDINDLLKAVYRSVKK